MQRSLVVEFTKMNGAGNDFIVIDNRFFQFSADDLTLIARTCCRRRFGIGADGLLAMDSPSSPEYHYRMRYLNADGSVGTMCGNGARCLALFARNAGIDAAELRFQTDAGPYRAEVAESGESIRLWLPPPYPSTDVQPQAVETEGGRFELFPIWTGTEHAVCFVADLQGTDVCRDGARLRGHPALGPAGANIDFVQVEPQPSTADTVAVSARTFEKGVEAETLACGTGAVASALVTAGRHFGRARRIDVKMPGGILSVGIQRDEDRVTGLYLEGPAAAVYRGSFDYPF